VSLLALVVTVAVGPVGGGAVLGAPAVVQWRRLRRRRVEAEAAVIEQVPEVIDLLRLALGAGLSVAEAVAAVGRWAPGPVGAALAAAHTEVDQGAPVADALDGARDRCGPAAAPLFAALTAAVRHGTPLDAALDRLGHGARLDRRRLAEERARRVPVQLLFPLVVCVLPAFGLLTVVPLLVNSLGALAG
jgi:tight adherence protein C